MIFFLQLCWLYIYYIHVYLFRGRGCLTATGPATPDCSVPRWWGTDLMWSPRPTSKGMGTGPYTTGNLNMTWNKCSKVAKWSTIVPRPALVRERNAPPRNLAPPDSGQIPLWSSIFSLIVARISMDPQRKRNIHRKSEYSIGFVRDLFTVSIYVPIFFFK